MAAKQSQQKIHVAVVTGTRAEYGMLKTVIDALALAPNIKQSLIVTGTHLVTGTWRDIARGDEPIAAKVRMQKKDESGYLPDTQALGRGVSGMGRVFDELAVDLVLVLGDRIEAYAAASAAAIGGRYVAHLHGGDRAEGVADESMRHAISHLAHLHFPATRNSLKRLVRMGIQSDYIWQVGSPAIDQLQSVSADRHAPAFIVMKHPVGESDTLEYNRMIALLKEVRRMEAKRIFPGWGLYLGPNQDPGTQGIQKAFESTFGAASLDHGFQSLADVSGDLRSRLANQWVRHLPRDIFLSLLAGCTCMIGNSSSGLIEAAALGVSAINIGSRQSGREKPATVVDVKDELKSIRAAIQHVLVRKKPRPTRIYGGGDTGMKIAQILSTLKLKAIPLRKQLAY